MNIEAVLLGKLRAWRDETARRQGVESYRIFPNATLEAIALLQPTTIESLQTVKGIKEVKSRLYGKVVIEIVQSVLGGGEESKTEMLLEAVEAVNAPVAEEPLSVSRFLDALNLELSGMAARIRGEVTSVDVRERVVYFSMKDKDDESVLNCLVFRYQYDMSGVKLSMGDEIIIEGVPDIYKPSGRLSFRVESIEYAGEGALKKAYDELYRKLEQEGVFAPEGKRVLPKFPERIALITSREGAAIGDFTMNLTRAGFQVHLYPSLVEGKRAVFEIVKAIEFFNAQPDQYDVLVIIRGGGSLESLQAFNTEALVRAVRESAIPVLAGIGHERDVSLAALAADIMVSTPTATAKHLSMSWDEARERIHREEVFLQTFSERTVNLIQDRLRMIENGLREGLEKVLEQVEMVERGFENQAMLLPEYLERTKERFGQFAPYWKMVLEGLLERHQENLASQAARIEQYDPMKVLRLGYSLVRKAGKVMRDAGQIKEGEMIDIQLGRGRVESEVKRVVLNS